MSTKLDNRCWHVDSLDQKSGQSLASGDGHLQRINDQLSMLLVLGARDNLVGDPEMARALVQDIPDIRVEVLDTGHLVAGEKPAEANALILAFFEE